VGDLASPMLLRSCRNATCTTMQCILCSQTKTKIALASRIPTPSIPEIVGIMMSAHVCAAPHACAGPAVRSPGLSRSRLCITPLTSAAPSLVSISAVQRTSRHASAMCTTCTSHVYAAPQITTRGRQLHNACARQLRRTNHLHAISQCRVPMTRHASVVEARATRDRALKGAKKGVKKGTKIHLLRADRLGGIVDALLKALSGISNTAP